MKTLCKAGLLLASLGTAAMAQARLVATPMMVMPQSPSLPPFSSAFQEACSRAANRTRAAIERVMLFLSCGARRNDHTAAVERLWILSKFGEE